MRLRFIAVAALAGLLAACAERASGPSEPTKDDAPPPEGVPAEDVVLSTETNGHEEASEPNAPDFDSKAAWQTVMRGHAVANGLFIAAANRTGREGQVTFYGSSFICDPGGAILAEGSRTDTDLVVADLEPAVLAQWRELFPLLHQRRPETYGRLADGPAADVARPAWLG